jgi:hypothetical protein
MVITRVPDFFKILSKPKRYPYSCGFNLPPTLSDANKSHLGQQNSIGIVFAFQIRPRAKARWQQLTFRIPIFVQNAEYTSGIINAVSRD